MTDEEFYGGGSGVDTLAVFLQDLSAVLGVEVTTFSDALLSLVATASLPTDFEHIYDSEAF